MTMILESIKDLRDVRNEHAVYVKDCNVLLKLYRESIAVIDLDNAMKPGKTCKNTVSALMAPTTVIAVYTNFLMTCLLANLLEAAAKATMPETAIGFIYGASVTTKRN